MTWVFALVLVITGVLVVVASRAGRPTVPLGVSVPRSRLHEPVVLKAQQAFLRGVVLATLLALGFLLGVRSASWAVTLAPLVQLTGVACAMHVARRPIIAAKDAEDWYDGVQVRLVARVVPDRPVRTPWWPYAASVAVSLGVIGHGLVIYDGLPGRIGSHFGFDGRADAWTNKSYLAVLGPALIPLLLTVVLGLIAWAVARVAPTSQPDGDLIAARTCQEVQRQGTQQVLGATALTMAVGVGLLVVMSWHHVVGWPNSVVLVGLMVVPLVFVARLVGQMLRVAGDEYAQAMEMPSSSRQVAPGRFADSPDDDRYWKGGIFYVNREDPRLLVPKRMGMGTTLNVARPLGMAVLVGSVLLIVGTMLLPLVLDR